MRRLGTSLAALTLAGAGLTVSGATAQAAIGEAETAGTQAASCNSAWPGRNGNMYAFRDINCGVLLGSTPGNDANWADGSGPFVGSDNDNASSVMNAGIVGGADVVKFFLDANYDNRESRCLAPGELYADWLGDNTYVNQQGANTGIKMENSISSHQWVRSSSCSGWVD